MTTSYCRHSPSLSRTGNVLHSFRQSAFACLSFNKVEEVQHIIVIPSDSHSGINYPPTASKDRAVHSMEIKDFLILWTYSQWRQAIVVIPPFSPERETFCMLPLISFRILTQKRPGIIGTKTRNCLRELHSLTVSKSVRFLYSEGAAGMLNCP